MHIEQGAVLEQQQLDLGIVTAITGLTHFASRLQRARRSRRYNAHANPQRCIDRRRRHDFGH
ncbi:MAG: hypothetical protein R2911_02560 [Caldilineaceae bacterium]